MADYVVRGADPDAVRQAMRDLPSRFRGVEVDGDDDALWDVSIRTLTPAAEVDLTEAMVKVHGRPELEPVLLWLADAIRVGAGARDVWDAERGAVVRDPPGFAAVEALLDDLERGAEDVGEGETNARRFVAYLVENDQLELAGAPADLYARVAEILDGPERGRAGRLEALLLDHPGVAELFGDEDSLSELVGAWG